MQNGRGESGGLSKNMLMVTGIFGCWGGGRGGKQQLMSCKSTSKERVFM